MSRFSFVFALNAWAIAAAGCPQSINSPGPSDAGAAGEDATTFADATTGHPDAITNDDAAEPADGGEPPDLGDADAGLSDSGMLQPLVWSQMTLPRNTASVGAVWGRSANEIYAGTSNGNLLRFDSSTGWTQVWHEPNNFGIRAIWGTADTTFVASDTTLHVHQNGIQQVPLSYAVGSWVYDIHGLSDTEVYIVSDRQNGRALYKYDGQDVDLLIEPDNAATLGAVYIPMSGRVFVGANGHLFRYESFTLFDETVDWHPSWDTAAIANFTFWDIAPVGSRLFAIGSRYLIFERDANGVWQRVYEPFLTDELQALTGFDNEAYAVGEQVTGGSILRYFDGTWTPGHYDQNTDLWDIWAANADEYFAVGNVNNTFDGVILRGTRP